MSERRQARLDAATALLEAGWSAERIALALAISRATVERLAPQPERELATPLLKAAAGQSLDGCCRVIADPRLGTSRYCDGPIAAPGAVYCARHYRSEIRPA